ncbi:MAG: diphthamide synthesis protein [Candidatus Woesearchaeota archaeon]
MNIEKYDFELDKIIEIVLNKQYTKILLQLPDGLKCFADKIQTKIQEKTNCEVLIWAGSNFGACDIPMNVEKLGVDLIVHFGHSKWN